MAVSARSVAVPKIALPEVWPLVTHWIRRAMERADLGSFDVVEADVFNDRALLWLVYDGPKTLAAVVTKIVLTEKSRVCLILAVGGEGAKDWTHLLSDAERYARAEGCDAIRLFGRRGWQRLLPDYSARNIVLEKRLL